MKKNIFGLIIVILSSINILYTLFIILLYDFGPTATNYWVGGIIISVILIYLIIKENKFGYLGTILFYGMQIIGTTLIFQNVRFGLILRWTQSFELIISDFSFEINFTALILFVLGVLGLKKYTPKKSS